MNMQIAEIIEQQQALLAIQEKELAETKNRLEQLLKASELCEVADAAKRKIEEAQKELEKAIAAMPPEIAAIYRGETIPEDNGQPVKEPVDKPVNKPVEKEISEKDVDKAIDYIAKKKHETNKTGLLRIKQPILEKAATKLGVQVVDSPTKKEIANAIYAMLNTSTSTKDNAPFSPEDMVQNSRGDIGNVVDCVKKDEDGSSAYNSSASELTTSSTSPPPVSEDIDPATNIALPGNGAATIPGDMPNLVIG